MTQSSPQQMQTEPQQSLPVKAPSHEIPTSRSTTDIWQPLEQAAVIKQTSDLLSKACEARTCPEVEILPILEKLAPLLSNINLDSIRHSNARLIEEFKQVIASDLKHKRENTLVHSRALGLNVQRMSTYDRVGPLRITHKKEKTNADFGNLPLCRITDSNGLRVAEKIHSLILDLHNDPFENTTFYTQFKTAYLRIIEKRKSQDRWVRIDHIYAEFIETIPATEKGKDSKIAERKKAQVPEVTFIIHFSRMLDAGQYPDGEHLRLRTPTMASMKDVYEVPSLKHPTASDRRVLDVQIEIKQ